MIRTTGLILLLLLLAFDAVDDLPWAGRLSAADDDSATQQAYPAELDVSFGGFPEHSERIASWDYPLPGLSVPTDWPGEAVPVSSETGCELRYRLRALLC